MFSYDGTRSGSVLRGLRGFPYISLYVIWASLKIQSFKPNGAQAKNVDAAYD